jgi:hypothetical protein
VTAIIVEFERRGMIAEGRLAAWERRNPQREDLGSTERSHAYRARQREAATQVQRTATHQTQRERQILPPLTPPLEVVAGADVERRREEDGTRADARASGPGLLDETGRKRLAKERWLDKMIGEAQRAMPPDRFVEFVAAIAEQKPPPWAITELNRLDRECKRRRASAPRQGSASQGGKARGAQPGQTERLLPIVGREAA